MIITIEAAKFRTGQIMLTIARYCIIDNDIFY